jgi:hypothetical protein
MEIGFGESLRGEGEERRRLVMAMVAVASTGDWRELRDETMSGGDVLGGGPVEKRRSMMRMEIFLFLDHFLGSIDCVMRVILSIVFFNFLFLL